MNSARVPVPFDAGNKVRVESLSIVPRHSTSIPTSPNLTAPYHLALVVGLSDGTAVLFKSVIEGRNISIAKVHARTLGSTAVSALEVVTATYDAVAALVGGRVFLLRLTPSSIEPLAEKGARLENVRLLGRVTEDPRATGKVVVVVKGKIMVATWDDTSGWKTTNPVREMVATDAVSQVAMHYERIIVASTKDIVVYDTTGQLVEQLSVDRGLPNPLQTLPRMSDLEGLSVRTGSTLRLFDGRTRVPLAESRTMSLPDDAVEAMYCYPFVVVIGAKGRCVARAMDGGDVTLEGSIVPCRAAASAPFVCVVASQRDVFLFGPHSVKEAAAMFVQQRKYSSAVACAASVGSESDVSATHEQCAIALFTEGHIAEAIDHFEQAGTPAPVIIQSIAGMLPPDHPVRSASQPLPTALPAAADPDAHALIAEFLTRWQRAHRCSEVERAALDYAVLAMTAEGHVPYTLRVVRPLLLPRCRIDAALVAHLHTIAVSTSAELSALLLGALRRAAEGLQLCEARGFVAEAAVLLQQADDPAMLTAHLPWMLLASPMEAVAAVVGDGSAEGFSSDVVLPLLRGHEGPCLYEYTHFAVTKLRSTEETLHVTHALNAIAMLRALLPSAVSTRPELKLRAGSEAGYVGTLRRELLAYLRSASEYPSDVVLAHLEDAGLVEEQVAVYCRDGRHDLALRALLYVANSLELAEDYCLEPHSSESRRRKGSVMTSSAGTMASPHASGDTTYNAHLITLLRLLLVPPQGHEPRTADAERILLRHVNIIHPEELVGSLPLSTSFAPLHKFLVAALQRRSREKSLLVIRREAMEAERLAAMKLGSLLHQRCVFVDDERPCYVCRKPVGETLVAVMPSLEVCHFRCFKVKETDPVRGVAFSAVM